MENKRFNNNTKKAKKFGGNLDQRHSSLIVKNTVIEALKFLLSGYGQRMILFRYHL